MAPRLVLFDDERARQWEPFALSRPAGELLFGALKLVERVEEALGLECEGYLTSQHLSGYREPGARPVLEAKNLPRDRDTLFWCSRAAPERGQRLETPDGPTVYVMGKRLVAYFAPAGQEPEPGFLANLELGKAPPGQVSVSGRLLEWVWELMLLSPAQLADDLAASDGSRPKMPEGVYVLGENSLGVAPDVRIEPGTVFDVSAGPIRLEDGVYVRSGTRLAGPALIGRHSRLLGGSFEALVAGPYSYLRGEVSHTVFLGYSNKVHDGYLGHAYVGRWVNLGALTTNSDLKNNYHSVRVWTPRGVRDTGELKIGCFLGDHAKTGIGTLLSTGTVVGAGANVYGSEMPPTYVPPFSWGGGEGAELGEYRLDAFIESAELAMGRRGMEPESQVRRYLESCWRKGRGG
ncbi:MAG: putative sugar nucleotidyl transferase [Gemmatimonadota bacterium]